MRVKTTNLSAIIFLFFSFNSFSMINLKIDSVSVNKDINSTFNGEIKAPIFEIKTDDAFFKINESNSMLDGLIKINKEEISVQSTAFLFKAKADFKGMSEKLEAFKVVNTTFKDIEKSTVLKSEKIEITYDAIIFNGIDFEVNCLKTPAKNLFNTTCLNNTELNMKEALFHDKTFSAKIPNAKAKISHDELSFSAPSIYLETDIRSKGVNPRGICKKQLNDQNTFDLPSVLKGCFSDASFKIDDFVSYDNERLLFSDLNNLKDINLNIKENVFNVLARVKMLATINVRFRGEIYYIAEKNHVLLKIYKGTVAGIPSTKFIISFIEKFIKSEDIIVNGNQIIIKLN